MSVLSSSYIKLQQLKTPDREKREDMDPLSKSVAVEQPCSSAVKPKECLQQMPVSNVSKLFTMGDTDQACWYIRDMKEGIAAPEMELRQTFLTPPTKVMKDKIIEMVNKQLDENFEPAKRTHYLDNDYDLDFMALLNIKRNYEDEERDGIKSATSKLSLFGKELVCKADAAQVDAVLKIDVPFGSVADEIPIHQLVNMVFEMEAYDRRVAYYCQYYSYNVWRTVVDRLVWMNKLMVKRQRIPPDTVVFYPTLNKTDTMATILKRIEQEAPEKDLWDFWKRYCNPAFFIPDTNPYDNAAWEEKDREYYMELHLRRYLDDIIKYTTNENLTEAGYDPSQIVRIIEKTRKGNSTDIKRGVMQISGLVLWEGENDAVEIPKDFTEGIKTILKIIMGYVTLKNDRKWNAFMSSLDKNTIRFLPAASKGDGFNKLVIQRIELTEGEFQHLFVKMEGFINNIESVMNKKLKCRGTTGKTLLGEYSKKKEFETFLRTLPVKTIVNKRINI